jgi:hypothetical protein
MSGSAAGPTQNNGKLQIREWATTALMNFDLGCESLSMAIPSSLWRMSSSNPERDKRLIELIFVT